MDPKRLITVSAENNPYMAWQCKLFHFSCISRLQQTPVIVVHETGAELHPDFQDIIKAGGRVHRAPSYKLSARGDLYAPRNTPGTLLQAGLMCDGEENLIVLCDPDMIFVRRTEFSLALSGDYCSYMNYDLDTVVSAREALGIPPGKISDQKEALRCGVPYSIPAREARALGEEWIKAIDAFPQRKWEDVMYAFGLAAVGLGLTIELTRMAQSNYWPDAIVETNVVHYCYGDATWSKRHYYNEEQARNVWHSDLKAREGTVLDEILSQIGEANEYYSSL